jgi:transcriptional regulator with GAF, ATPase, and Fis domain/predicted ATPase
VDHRADLYSVGIILFELLTGVPPFVSDDPLELVHWQVARTPPAPAGLDPRVEGALSAVVAKLLAKTPEDRYQSAEGARHDLDACLDALARDAALTGFAPATADASDRFMVSEKLYGRERELRELVAVFDDVCTGVPGLAFIAGASGAGKTVLIQELYKPLVRERGAFTSGKFDLAARNVPFGGLIQAFGGLLRQMLAGSERELEAWRERATESLGAGAGVLAGVLPEIELLLGPQPLAPPLDGAEALNRFQMAVVNFLATLAGPGRPLVVFLDDLQWADVATLNLLAPLATSSAISHLLIVGAYRDTEIDDAHPLLQTLSGLDASGVKLSRIALAPLVVSDVEALVTDTLRRSGGDVAALARLVHTTTAGSPFFVTQLLKTLHRENLLRFDPAACSWVFSLDHVADRATTDDVVELMTSRIQRLDPKTQRTLMFAGLLGGRYRASTVAAASESTVADTEAGLREAVAEGLVMMAGDTYRFLHDRVQQAAIGLLPDADRGPTHAAIGRRLLAQWDRSAAPEQVFEVVGHLNRGLEFHEAADRLAIARLNLDAGRRAKAATAWESAAGYFDRGIACLGSEVWSLDANVGFALHLEAVDCHYLARHFTAAEGYAATALAHARSPVEAAQLHALQMVVHENLSQYELAVTSGRTGLALLGVMVPDDAGAAAALETEIQTIEKLRGGRTIGSLIDLPAMVDPSTQLAMRILTSLWSSAYISGHQVVARWISASLVRLSLTLGNTEDSAYGYVTHAITIGPERGDYAAAYEWGRLALAVNERFDDRKRRAKIHQQFHAHVCLWRRPLAECLPHAREATRAGLESGDLNYAGYGAVTETWAAFPIANDLAKFVRDYEPAVAVVERLHLDHFRSALRVMLGWALALQGRTVAPTSLTHSHFDETSYLQKFGGEVFFRTFYFTAKLQLCVLLDDVAGARAALRELDRGTLAGTIWPVLADFWGGLALTARFASTTPEDQARDWARLVRARDSLQVLADNAPQNYRVMALLLSAEMARVTRHTDEAVRLAAEAVAYATEVGNLHQQALGNEIGARAVTIHAGPQAALPLLTEAMRGYDAWGAQAKVDQMRTSHPALLDVGDPVAGAHAPAERGVREAAADIELSLDVATVLKISQAIAVEIRLADLLPKLMRIAIESAGAQRGLFIQESKAGLVIEAEGDVAAEAVRALEALPIDDGTRVPVSVVRYVRNTSMSVVVSDALRDDRFSSDPYVQLKRPRSILSVPVVHEGRVSGILYLEHRLAPGVFTNERVNLMQLVSAQAAIALENAGLYRAMTDEAAQRRRAEEMLREVTEGTATALGEGFFRSLVQHLASALRVRYAFVTECREARTRARSLAFWNGDRIADNFEYEVADTPCKGVFAGAVCYYPRDVQRGFPKDLDLVSLKAESYLGAPMVDAGGQVIGHIAVLDERPMEDDTWAASVLSIFSARAGAELERLHAERELRAALEEVETLKNRLQDENVYLQDEIRGEHNFEDMVGNSQALLDVLRKVERIAVTDATVLILGETGTGKELVARALHSRSARKHRPLVKVNCGAISAGLVESELFGHVKGAFTGAIDKRVGRFELAHGGTIFLDEVGELPLDSQVKLLRVLQEQEFEPVGSSRTVRVNVRVIAATNRDLDEAVAEGRFRADLYFRLNVLALTVPPLRERQADIPLLVTFFVSRFARQFGKRIDAIAQETMRLLSRYAWPGNIRELQNVVERAVVLADGPVLNLGTDLLPLAPERGVAAVVAAEGAPSHASGQSLEGIERRHIESVLRQTNYVIEGAAGAAQVLNLHPNTLRSRMKKLGIHRPRNMVATKR